MNIKNLKTYMATGPAAAAAQKNHEILIAIFVGVRRRVTRRSLFGVLVFIFIFLNSSNCVWAEDKSWTAGGDQSGWFDDANWLPAAAPTASDDVMINRLDASVTLPQAFDAKSLTLGGKRPSLLTVSNFSTGTIEPANATDLAVYNRKDGHLILKGSVGKITLKGAYKDSEEVIPDEPSFIFYVS